MDFKDHDEGEENLDITISIIEEQEKLQKEILALGSAFVEDVQERMKEMDTQYLTGLKNFFTVYMDTIRNTEPASSATPKFASLLHTHLSPQSTVTQVAGTRHMHVQPTAISRRRE